MNISKIELVLENCEVISVDAKYIGKIFADNMYPVTADRQFFCDTFCIELHKDLDAHGVIQSYELLKGVFDRLTTFDDIAQVVVKYKDGVEETYFVDYDGDEENINQESYISAAGHLYISISSDTNLIEELFDSSVLVNPDYAWPWKRA